MYIDPDELKHYGVLGMKWGVRKDRKGSRVKKRKSKTNRRPSADAKEFSNLQKKKPHEMSNAELKRYTQRGELLNKHSKMNPSKIKRGRDIATTIVATAGTMGAVYALKDNPALKATVKKGHQWYRQYASRNMRIEMKR